jgi:hypothetical protein
VLVVNEYDDWLTTSVLSAHKRTTNRGKLQTYRMVTRHGVGDGSHNRDEESDERRVVETPPDLDETVRSLMVELQICKADNKRLIKEQEK